MAKYSLTTFVNHRYPLAGATTSFTAPTDKSFDGLAFPIPLTKVATTDPNSYALENSQKNNYLLYKITEYLFNLVSNMSPKVLS